MNILIINLILTTAEKGVITRRKSIKDTMISSLGEGFVENGHKVTIVASEDFKPTKSESYPFEIIYFKSRYPKLFRPDLLPCPIGLKRWLKLHCNEYDLVVSSENFSIGSLIASLVCKKKLVIWQEMAQHQRKFHQMPSKFWYNVVNGLFMKGVLAVPRSRDAHRFISQYCRNVSKEIVDNGANGKILYPSAKKDKSFMILSQLIPRKRVDTMITQFAKLVSMPQYADYTLNVIGDGILATDLKQQAIDLNVGEKVVFHGFLRHRELAEMLRKSTALLVNTARDLNMVSINESIISGTPVVMNTVPTTASFVANHRLGIVQDNWDEKQLVEVIENNAQFHEACLNVRDSLTNVGCARKLIEIYTRGKSAY